MWIKIKVRQRELPFDWPDASGLLVRSHGSDQLAVKLRADLSLPIQGRERELLVGAVLDQCISRYYAKLEIGDESHETCRSLCSGLDRETGD